MGKQQSLKFFFDTIRPMFGGSLSQPQVDGINFLLEEMEGLDIKEKAYLLATTFHETAQTMQPIEERGSSSYFKKYEPETKIGKNLGNIFSGDGIRFKGRGYVQITGRYNYTRLGRKLHIDLENNPEAALDKHVAAKLLIVGCMEGLYTGLSLKQCLPDYVKARKVVNGTDRANRIANYAEVFESALDPLHKPLVPLRWWQRFVSIVRKKL